VEFAGKAVLVTGGSSGIGLETARLFLQEGASVTISGRSAGRLESAAAALMRARLRTVAADITRPDECRRLVDTAKDAFGRLDIVVNSAGIWVEGDADKVTPDEYDRVMDTNLKGTFFVCRYAIPWLEESGAGVIVNVSSDSGVMGNDLAALYCASKGGVTLLTKSLAVELARKNIRVNAVCPGDVATPMLDRAWETYHGGDRGEYEAELLGHYPQRPGRRFTRPEEVARSILFLASPRVEAISGACLAVDFGLTAGY